ncbi:MAG: NAD(P)/FAD-dependent oxidoreductase [Erysipelotrichaceae bacterium]
MTKILIIGAGPAGTAAALKAAEAGWETVLIEKDKLGGTCLQRGCIPTKALLEEAHLLNLARRKFGAIDIDEAAMFERKDKLVFELTASLTQQIQAKKITVLTGEACFIDAHTVEVNGTSMTADHILIATGSVNRVFDFLGDAKLWTSDDALFTPLKGKQRILLIGGGVIGIELAAYYHDLGHDVTIFEKENRILPNVPKDLVQSITMDYKKEGIRIVTSVMITSITKNGYYTVKQNDQSEDFDVVVLCAGRIPATASLNLDNAGIAQERGLIVVDANYQTNIPHIYAVGDASCRVQLAHVASKQANLLMEYLIDGKECPPFLIPSAIYTPIQAAWLGKSEDELKAQGIPYRAYRQPLGALAKSKIKGDGRRYISVNLDDQNRLLGVSLYLSDASEFLPFFTFLMEHHIPFTQAGDIVYPHPTLSEAIGELAAIIRSKNNTSL